MIRFPWPGNVRQLRNVIEKFSLLFEFGITFKSLLQEEPLGFVIHESGPRYKALRERKFIEPQRITQTLAEHNANRSSTARALGISRGALNYQIRKHGLAIV
jgi:transcriptional regulator with PAS, ATPase and Fis domain